MSYITRKAYNLEKQVLFNNCNTNNLNQQIMLADKVVNIAGYRRVFEGTIMTAGGILKRAKLISPYTSGGNTIITNYPYPFAVGDILYEIGDSTENAIAEAAAISGATQILGTVTAIDTATTYQVTEVTPSGVAIGDVFSVEFGYQAYTFTATTTNVADVTAGLLAAINSGLRSHHSLLDFLEITEDGTKLVFTAKEPAEIFTITGSVVGTGALDIQVTTAVGAITITPDGGNNSHAIGAKIGTIDQVPLGIIANSFYLNDNENLDKTMDIAAYDMANIYKKSLPYLDGQIVQSLPTLKYSPAYGL